MASDRRSVSALVAGVTGLTALGVAFTPLAGAATAPTHTYQHGSYAQAHYPTAAACATASSTFLATLKRAGASVLDAGQCHPIDILSGTTKLSGYTADVTYRSTAPRAKGDVDLGASPAATAGQHSFRDKYSAASQTDVQWHFQNDTLAVAHKTGGKVTYTTGVKKNAATGRYEFEIDYNARTPTYPNHVQISEQPNVTSPSIGVKTPIPTAPTSSASNSGVKKPGDGTMGWPKNTGTAPSKATAPKGPVTTPGTKTTTAGTVTSPTTGSTLGVQGIDISAHTSINDWAGWKKSGVRFVYTKASEGNYYTNPQFATQYTGAYRNGIVRGAYHFGNPSVSTGADQADYFLAHGGGWSNDGKTLPGVLDIEWNPYGDMCFNLTKDQMNTWIRSFVTEYKAKTGVKPMIYTASIWWNRCVGSPNYSDVPLWVAQYSPKLGALPTSWSTTSQLIWQNAALDGKGYDTDVFNGSMAQLNAYALLGRRG